MVLNGFSKTLLSLTFASALGLTAFEAAAAGECKGLEASACSDNPACTWVSAYTTKNGNSVSAYCRAASGKASKAVSEKEQHPAVERSGSASDKANNMEEKRG